MFDIHFVGGAVMNAVNVLNNPRSFYMKTQRDGRSGNWDLAAFIFLTILMVAISSLMAPGCISIDQKHFILMM